MITPYQSSFILALNEIHDAREAIEGTSAYVCLNRQSKESLAAARQALDDAFELVWAGSKSDQSSTHIKG